VKAVKVQSDRGLRVLPEPRGAMPKRSEKKRSGGTPKPREAAVATPVDITRRSALRFGPPVALLPAPVPPPVAAPKPSREKQSAEKHHGEKIDPAYLQAARELRDRYLERLNERPGATASCGKYDVSRALAPVRPNSSSPLALPRHPSLQLPAAA
jgi:hypothetical protein